MLTIDNLKNRPHHFDKLARWHHAQWSHYYPDETLTKRKKKMVSYLDESFIPSTFIALEGEDELVGSAAIITNDLETRPSLSPWLASVFVKPEKRNQGIGTALVQHVMDKAKDETIKKLYLFTPDQQKFYTRIGWHEIDTEYYHGEDVSIMQLGLI